MIFQDDIRKFVNSGKFGKEVCDDFLQLLESGEFIRDEGAKKHYSVFFLPYNSKTKEIFIIHHKKSGLWLSPGGHIDSGENPLDTLKREIKEELGVEYGLSSDAEPFFLSTVEIDNPQVQQCKKHYDIWYLMETNGDDFNVDPREFLDTKWVSPNEARALVTDPSVLEAINLVETGSNIVH